MKPKVFDKQGRVVEVNGVGKSGGRVSSSQQRLVGLLAPLAHVMFGHKPEPGYRLAWEYSLGFFTQCRFCGQPIVRDYNGQWHAIKQPKWKTPAKAAGEPRPPQANQK